MKSIDPSEQVIHAPSGMAAEDLDATHHSELLQPRLEALYAPLDSTKAQIRLLKLESRKDEQEMRFSMIVFDFASAPSYKALSYEWVSQVCHLY
jgi:hypothetical protein